MALYKFLFVFVFVFVFVGIPLPLHYRITIAKVANLLDPGTWVSAVKSNNFATGMLQA